MNNTLTTLLPEITQWRRDIHQHPELGFNEYRTSDLVADKLQSFGVEVHRGLAKTGVVGTLKVGDANTRIGLRADMDALPIQELNTFSHSSVNQQVMHACGHDGHTAMLLGAAKHLAQTRAFNGTVHFIFQPAEEGTGQIQGGAASMIKDGLFEQFPMDAVYGMRNWPGLPLGQFGVRSGAMMASADNMEIRIIGKGGHAAMPQQAIDPIVIGSQLVGLLQTIVSRTMDPLDSVVVSVTQLEGGSTFNVIPDSLTLRGTIRTLNPKAQQLIQQRIEAAVNELCAAFGARGEVSYQPVCPVLINSPAETDQAIAVAQSVAGKACVDDNCLPTMGGEDFAFMLEQKPGCYLFVGNGGGEQDGGACMLHNPEYDFNDGAIEWGVNYWCQLVETLLAK